MEYPYFRETICAYAERYGLQMKLVYSVISSVCDEFKLTGCSTSSIMRWNSITKDRAEAVATAIVRLTVPIDEEYSKRSLGDPTPGDEVPSVWLPDPEERYLEALRWMRHGVESPAPFGGAALPIDALAAVFLELAANPSVRTDEELQGDLVDGVFLLLNAACLTDRGAAFSLSSAASGLRSIMAAGGGEPASVVASANKRAEAFRERSDKWKRTLANESARFRGFIDSQNSV